METDKPPRQRILLEQFKQSDQLESLEIPEDDRFRSPARAIQATMNAGRTAAVQSACTEFLAAAADFYAVPQPRLRVLAARPLRVREGGWATELFGDYDPNTGIIRVWMRTAVRKQVTSIGTFLSTLCHEWCHHLDCARFGFSDSPHTRGFYERTAVLYHHARETPRKRIFWMPAPGGRWRVNWARTAKGK